MSLRIRVISNPWRSLGHGQIKLSYDLKDLNQQQITQSTETFTSASRMHLNFLS